MTYQEIQPKPEYRQFIKFFWTLDETNHDPNARQVLYPDSHPELILNIGDPLRIDMNGRVESLPAFFCLGIQLSKVELLLSKNVRFFSARLYPWASMRLPHQIAEANAIRNLDDLITSTINNIHDFVSLVESLIESDVGLIGNLVQVFYEQDGPQRVVDAAKTFDLSSRTLERFFQQHATLPAKQLLRVRRFEKALVLLSYYPTSSLAEVGLSLGYSDQAHFQREFKQFSDMTPGQFVQSFQKKF